MERDASLLALNLSPSQIECLRRYEALIVERAMPRGLVSAADRRRVWDRHIVDSLRAAPLLTPELRSFLDIGSGAGLPGIPLAIARPEASVSLVEPRSRRAAFLEMAVDALGLKNATVVPTRVESTKMRVEACLARAVAPAHVAWGMAEPRLLSGGFLIYWAGRSWSTADEAQLAEVGVRAEIRDQGSQSGQGPLVIMAKHGHRAERTSGRP